MPGVGVPAAGSRQCPGAQGRGGPRTRAERPPRLRRRPGPARRRRRGGDGRWAGVASAGRGRGRAPRSVRWIREAEPSELRGAFRADPREERAGGPRAGAAESEARDRGERGFDLEPRGTTGSERRAGAAGQGSGPSGNPGRGLPRAARKRAVEAGEGSAAPAGVCADAEAVDRNSARKECARSADSRGRPCRREGKGRRSGALAGPGGGSSAGCSVALAVRVWSW